MICHICGMIAVCVSSWCHLILFHCIIPKKKIYRSVTFSWFLNCSFLLSLLLLCHFFLVAIHMKVKVEKRRLQFFSILRMNKNRSIDRSIERSQESKRIGGKKSVYGCNYILQQFFFHSHLEFLFDSKTKFFFVKIQFSKFHRHFMCGDSATINQSINQSKWKS